MQATQSIQTYREFRAYYTSWNQDRLRPKTLENPSVSRTLPHNCIGHIWYDQLQHFTYSISHQPPTDPSHWRRNREFCSSPIPTGCWMSELGSCSHSPGDKIHGIHTVKILIKIHWKSLESCKTPYEKHSRINFSWNTLSKPLDTIIQNLSIPWCWLRRLSRYSHIYNWIHIHTWQINIFLEKPETSNRSTLH